MAVDRYAVIYRDGSEAMAHDPSIPNLTRLIHFAFARTDSRGHARFHRGELARLLSVERQELQRLIKRAVRDRWLFDESCSECLILPGHISDRRYVTDTCPVHDALSGSGTAA